MLLVSLASHGLHGTRLPIHYPHGDPPAPSPGIINLVHCEIQTSVSKWTVDIRLKMPSCFSRTFIYSAFIRGGKPTPLIAFVAALVFCSYNGYLQGRYFTEYAQFPDRWTSTGCFQIGEFLYFASKLEAVKLRTVHM